MKRGTVGDPSAFEALFDQHHRALLAYALRRSRAIEDAEDAAAETFAIAWRRVEDIPDDPLPWLYGVARRVLANRRRADERRGRLLDRLRRAPPPAVEGRVAPPSTPAIEALERLSPDDQELLRLVAWEELKHAEIAIVLGVSPNAIAIRLHRARKRFAAELARPPQKGSDPSRTSSALKGRIFGRPRRKEAE